MEKTKGQELAEALLFKALKIYILAIARLMQLEF